MSYESPYPVEEYTEMRYADFGTRFLAFLIDVIILTTVTLILFGVLFAVFYANGEIENEAMQGVLIAFGVLTYFLAPLTISTLYHSILESSKQQGSVGKMIMKIKVITEEGEPISFMRSVARNLGRVVSGIFLIGYFMTLFTDKKQTLHDLMVNSLVVHKDI